MAPKRATRSARATTTPTPTATTTTNVTNAQLQAMIDQGVSAALAARDATRNGTDSHSSGTGVRGSERVARECTYQDFMKCKPLYFKGTEGVVELTQWFERMETVLLFSSTTKFSRVALLCVRMFPEEADKIERYVVRDSPESTMEKTSWLQSQRHEEAIEMATELMDEESQYIASGKLKNKRKLEKPIQKQPETLYLKGLKDKKKQKRSKPTRNREKDKEQRRQKKSAEIAAGSARHSQTQSKIEIKEVKSQKSSQGAIIVKCAKFQVFIRRFKDQGT
ncbi:hypothetical protein Tco_1285296 [Tanacetum coccineum]